MGNKWGGRCVVVFMRIIIAFIILASITLKMSGQCDEVSAQYYNIPAFYNTGAIGTNDDLNITASGMLHQPLKCIQTGVDRAFLTNNGHRIGAGIKAYYVGNDVCHGFIASIAGAWMIKTGSGVLSIGIASGIKHLRSALNTEKKHKTGFDSEAGVWYRNKRFRAGISATHIGATKRNDSITLCKPTLYFTTGYSIEIKKNLIDLEPSLLLAKTGKLWHGQTTLRSIVKQIFQSEPVIDCMKAQ